MPPVRDPADRPDAYRRTMGRAAELAGEPSPDDEPLEVTCAKAGPQRVNAVEPAARTDIAARIDALPPVCHPSCGPSSPKSALPLP